MKTIILFLLLSVTGFSQDQSILKLFPGKWKMTTDKMLYYEEWKILNDTELSCIGFSIEEGDTVLSEINYLKRFADIWAYVAIPVNQSITLFAMTESAERKFVFENKEHDYPQRIIYEFVSDSVLNAAVEGMLDGELMRRDFSFIKTD